MAEDEVAGNAGGAGRAEESDKDALLMRELLEGARSAVFFGGAGVSTASGIPDFRSGAGLYHMPSGVGYPPETVVSHSFLGRHPREFWDFYATRMLYPDARPNACHRALARLERQGRLAGVVTQNIDGLHQAAGSREVVELHGSALRNHCVGCGRTYTLEQTLEARARQEDGVPRCADCGSMVRPDVVLYEEPLDEQVMARAAELIRAADVLVVAGTSLAVWPAAGFIDLFGGERLVVANISPTPADDRADLVVRTPLGQAFDW